MPAKTATKTANIVATLYDGAFDVSFDCVGVEACRYALCSTMPPDGSEECTFREHGSCRHTGAKLAALESMKIRLNKESKRLEEEIKQG